MLGDPTFLEITLCSKNLILIYRSIPQLKQRIAGKSLPVEKFAVKKSARFFNQGGRLTLPLIELMYVWNFMKILCKNYQTLEEIYVMIDSEAKKLKAIKPEGKVLKNQGWRVGKFFPTLDS